MTAATGRPRTLPQTRVPAARVAILTGLLALVLLAALHVLSPEFQPSWRMVSEYANGRYGWVLSLMFLTWGLSTWALAACLAPDLRGVAGRFGLAMLVVAGAGEAMASVFDINHPVMHGVAGLLGVVGLPIAATAIAVSLPRASGWTGTRGMLRAWAAATWLVLAALIGSLVQFGVSMRDAMGHTPQHAPSALPGGVIAVVGWANRLLVIVYLTWAIAVAISAMRARG